MNYYIPAVCLVLILFIYILFIKSPESSNWLNSNSNNSSGSNSSGSNSSGSNSSGSNSSGSNSGAPFVPLVPPAPVGYFYTYTMDSFTCKTTVDSMYNIYTMEYSIIPKDNMGNVILGPTPPPGYYYTYSFELDFLS